MLQLFMMGGPFMWILLLITITVVTLSVRDAIALSTGRNLDRMEARNASAAILFWGCIAAVIGFLASLIGLYLSLSIIRQAGLVNPNLMAEGVMVALVTTITGLLILAFSAVSWFTLRWWLRKALSSGDGQSAVAA
jgi:biopolymer transport protein ExbB/TolQ